MDRREEPVSILFADICGSTPLYEDTGDQAALALVGQSLDEMTRAVTREGGDVVRCKGDDLLGTFGGGDSALRAALAMVSRSTSGALPVRVGLHYGPVIRARDDIFGDAVNVAARLLSLGRPDEILASADFAAQLSASERGQLRLFDRQVLRGKSEVTELYLVLRHDEGMTELHTMQFQSGGLASKTVARLVLRFREQEVVCREGGAVVTIGRAVDNDLVVPEPRVSRQHAIVSAHAGKISLTDRSSLGTWVSTQTGDILLRRESAFLLGRGSITLASEPSRDGPTTLAFERSELSLF